VSTPTFNSALGLCFLFLPRYLRKIGFFVQMDNNALGWFGYLLGGVEIVCCF